MKTIFFREDETVRSGWKIFAFIMSVFALLILVSQLFPGLNDLSQIETKGISWIIFFVFLSFLFPFYIITYVFEIYWNKDPWETFHLSFAKGWVTEFLQGFLMGFAVITSIFLIYSLFGFLHVDPNFQSFQSLVHMIFKPMLGFLLIMALIEELVFRGYIFRELTIGTNKYMSIAVLSMMFSLVHLGNNNPTVISVLNIFLTGIVFSLSVLFTNRLWFAWGLHFGWNYFMGPIFSFKLSGFEIRGLFDITVTGPDVLVGQKFGPEGGLIATVIIILMGIILWKFYASRYDLQVVDSREGKIQTSMSDRIHEDTKRISQNE